MSDLRLFLGGARSGKSARAEFLAKGFSCPIVYLATAPHIEGDAEWAQRLQRHRQQRPSHWQTLEEPLALAERLLAPESKGSLLLIDCLTLWLSNLLWAGRDLAREQSRLSAALEQTQAKAVFLVSNEVGMGLVPETAEGRGFRDAQGRLNQAIAAQVHRVEFLVAGLPLLLKDEY